ncbi:MAG TPA: response regulator, partial [Herpetosiphonaceae bacterium]|nr:response regulator [Herpetosiphonaceae bacterium]
GDATSGEISRIMSTFIAVVLFLVIILDRFGGSLRTALLATLAREAELEQLRAGLEETVAARTAALTRALAAAEEARAAADHANQLKTRFLANMSHELRTPLNAILNFTDMVGLPRFGPLTEGQRELQQRVLASAEHLLGLINDILDLAKIEAGRMDLLYETVDLSALLRSMMSTAAGLTNDKGLQLILDVPDDLPPVRIDKTRIRQVLLNLLSNAAKFTEHGSITLQARILPDSLIEVAVVDTGIGIEPADHGMVFEEFRQVQDSNTRSYGGTGLGLPISRRLIEMHGGQMAMDSAPGRGSTFAFTLPMLIPLPPLPRPALEAALAGPLAQIPGPADGAQPLVVVVDDDPDAQAILGQQLTGAGYAIHPILDSRAALAAISAIQPRLVILDVQMPHVDGWAVLNQLRGDAATAAIPVMMCTIVDEQRQGVLLGASDYVLKPVRKDDFLGRVRRWLDQPAPVLVVDDDADARRIAREALESQGYAVREAANGAAALARLAESKPALIILDLMMPVMDGFEVLQWLDGHPDYQGIPVIVVSARDLTPDEAAWVRTRACEHLQKGQVTNDRLLRHIHHCIQAGQTPAA